MTSGRLDRVILPTQNTLTYLELSFSNIKIVENINKLSSLEFFVASHNVFRVSPSLSGLQRLEEVNLSENEIIIISASDFRSLPSLKTIYLGGNNIKTIHGRLFLPNLEEIQLSRNNIDNIDGSNASILRNTKFIDLSSNNLKVLQSAAISMFVQILILSDNKLTQIPIDSMTSLYHLNTLWVDSNKITHIKDLPYLPKLNILILNDNPLRFIAKDAFLKTPLLRHLNLEHVGMTSFPYLADYYPNMELIELSHNFIETFPEDIVSYFPNLVILHIAGNRIRGFNFEVLGKLDKLKFLDISDNPIRRFEINSSLPLHTLKMLYFGSEWTEFVGQQLYEALTNLESIVLMGSQRLHVPRNIFCGLGNATSIRMIGLNLSVNKDASCIPYLKSVLTVVSDATIHHSTLRELISYAESLFLIKIKMLQQEELDDTIAYAAYLTRFTYAESGLTQFPRVFAPVTVTMNLSFNLLTHLCLCSLTTFYPNFYNLHVSHNRIKVLSSCKNGTLPQHPLTDLYLDGNDLGTSKHDAFWDGFRILSSLQEIDLRNNNLSFLGRGLVPANAMDRPPYHLLTILADENPLICDCRQRWLMEIASHTTNVQSGRCSEPKLHEGRSLHEVIELGFPCSLMMLTEEDIPMCDLENGTARIRCPVISHPSPSVSWLLGDNEKTTISLGHVIISTRLVQGTDYFGNIGQHLVLELNLQEQRNLTDSDMNIDYVLDLSLTCRGSYRNETMDIDIDIRVGYGIDVGSSKAGIVSIECHSVQREECTGTDVHHDPCNKEAAGFEVSLGLLFVCVVISLSLGYYV